MTKVITIFERKNDEVLNNHRRYALMHAYNYQWFDVGFLVHDELRTVYKYNILLHQLRACTDGELVVLLDGHTAIMDPISIDQAMAGCDAFVCNGPDSLVMTNLLVMRNNALNRALLYDMLYELHARLTGSLNHTSEFEGLKAFDIAPTHAMLHECYMNIYWTTENWYHARIFALNLGPKVGLNDARELYRDGQHDPRLEQILFRSINSGLAEGRHVLPELNDVVFSADLELHINPNSPIAFVVWVQDNLSARIFERSVQRYSEHHGYAAHIYRESPDASDFGCLRFDIMREHLAQHDWVIFLTSDVLFSNPAHPLALLLEGRDALFAQNICKGSIHAGFMAFKNTPDNDALFAELIQKIASGCTDAQRHEHIVRVLEEKSMLNECNIMSGLLLNSPPSFMSADTFTTCYQAVNEPYRSIYMAHDEAHSLRQGQL